MSTGHSMRFMSNGILLLKWYIKTIYNKMIKLKNCVITCITNNIDVNVDEY